MLTTLTTTPAIDLLLRQPAAQAVGWALLQFIWQGAAIGVLTAVALGLLRRSASDVRYVVASIGLALMLTLPIVTGVQKYQALPATATTTGARSTAGSASARSDWNFWTPVTSGSVSISARPMVPTT